MFARQLLVGSMVLLSGCSLAFVDGPPDFIPANEPVPPGSCSVERVLPILDAVGAGASLIVALTDSEGDAVRFGAVVSAGLGFSSYTGFRRVNSCKERLFMQPAGPPVDTVLAGLFGETTPLFGGITPVLAGPLLPDPIFTGLSPNRDLTGSGIWPKRN